MNNPSIFRYQRTSQSVRANPVNLAPHSYFLNSKNYPKKVLGKADGRTRVKNLLELLDRVKHKKSPSCGVQVKQVKKIKDRSS